MKKHLTQTLIVLILSMGGALLLPNLFKYNKTLEWPGTTDFTGWTIAIFAVISIFLAVYKPTEKPPKVPDGYHELYNANNQITKKGMFANGQQVNGTKHVYKKDGILSHIENCTNGVYTKKQN
jgi:hypothetical protein